MRTKSFHGRFETEGQECQAPGCREAGEFRAPGPRGSGFDGPGDYFWFCLDHVREFNAAYDWFAGMSADEILDAQSPVAGWRTENRVFSGTAGIDGMPRWSDFSDPLDAISGRAAAIKARAAGGARETYSRFTSREQEALSILGLQNDTDRGALRRRYSELVRRYHPDRNGGDRSHEARLGRVVEAYQLLRKSAVFN
ncbi:MAG: J domain-containing protein [Pontixanthobacter sp.]